MEELINFLQQQFPEGCSIMLPQFERTEKLEFEWLPQNEAEFRAIAEKAPYSILYGFGFRKWNNMNDIIKENQDKPVSNMISLPILNAEGETHDIDLGRGNAPTEFLDIDEDIVLFPAEWYEIIPDDFVVTGLNGESYSFKKGVSDNDQRFGCLPYGVRRKVS